MQFGQRISRSVGLTFTENRAGPSVSLSISLESPVAWLMQEMVRQDKTRSRRCETLPVTYLLDNDFTFLFRLHLLEDVSYRPKNTGTRLQSKASELDSWQIERAAQPPSPRGIRQKDLEWRISPARSSAVPPSAAKENGCPKASLMF